MRKIKEKRIGWSGMKQRIENILKNCSCKVLVPSRSNAQKITRYRKINSSHVRERFQIDLTNIAAEIPHEAKESILNVKDHFSKYSWSFLLKDKCSISVAEALESLFAHGEIPEMIQSDNGQEFKGEVVKLLSKYKIKHIHSRPYNPKCQGLVENYNRYLKRYLLLSYYNSRVQGFNLKEKINEITDGYNNKVHTVTRAKPNFIHFTKNRKAMERL